MIWIRHNLDTARSEKTIHLRRRLHRLTAKLPPRTFAEVTLLFPGRPLAQGAT
jgi:hypothetical protein